MYEYYKNVEKNIWKWYILTDDLKVPKIERGLEGGTNMNYRKAILDKEATSIKIRSLISSSAFSREELAWMLQLGSSRVIYDWESGRKLPNIENLYNLSLIFQLKMEDLLVMS